MNPNSEKRTDEGNKKLFYWHIKVLEVRAAADGVVKRLTVKND